MELLTANCELPSATKRPRMEAASKLSGVMLEIVSREVQTGGAQTAVSDRAEVRRPGSAVPGTAEYTAV